MNHSWGGSQEDKKGRPGLPWLFIYFGLKGKKSALKENEKMIGSFSMFWSRNMYSTHICARFKKHL